MEDVVKDCFFKQVQIKLRYKRQLRFIIKNELKINIRIFKVYSMFGGLEFRLSKEFGKRRIFWKTFC